MFVKDPIKPALIEVSKFILIESVDDENGDFDVDFYTNLENEPDYTITFPDKEKRDSWFNKFASRYTHV